ncbi:MAG: FHA domain-containing protein, partial [Pseudonocardiales bacterium]
DIEVYLARDDQLHTGVFGVASRMEPKAPPRRRPHDSMSLPIVQGMPPGEYPRAYGAGPDPRGLGGPDPSAHGAVGLAPPPVAQAAAPPPHQAPQPYVAPSPPSVAPGRPINSPSLVVDQTNQRFELRVGSNVVGRGTDADLQLLDQGISRRHLDIQFDGNFATAYDLGSTNGTSVNGHEVGSQLLRHGDVVRVGHTRLVFHQAQG